MMELNWKLLDAAHVVRLAYSRENRTLMWDGYCDPIREVCGGMLPATLPEFAKAMKEGSQDLALNVFNGKSPTQGQISFEASEKWAFHYHRSSHSTDEIFIHCLPSSTQEQSSLQLVQGLNARLVLGMSEAHHRVKNTLQNVISYINFTIARKNVIDHDESEKLVRYIHSLASLHDILLEEVRSEGDGKKVRLDRIIAEVIAVNSNHKEILSNSIPELMVTPRRAATLSLIVNELLDNAHKYGEGSIKVTVEMGEDSNVARLEVANRKKEPRQGEKVSKASGGLDVARLLAKADLQSPLAIEEDQQTYRVRIAFPVIQP